MNQVALYWPNDDHAHLRYHSYEYFATNHFTPCMETYTRIWQQKQENPILNLPRFLKKTILPFLKSLGYRSYTGMVLLAVENGLLKEWLLDEKEGAMVISGFVQMPEDTIKPGMKGVHIHDLQGTWSVYESRILDGAGYYLMEREGGVGNNFVILNGKGEVVAKDVAAFDGKVIQTTREKRKALQTRLSRITAYSKEQEATGESVKKYPGIPRGELPGREHCGEPVSVRARLLEKQEILRKYMMGKGK